MEHTNVSVGFSVENLWELWERYCQDFKCPVVFNDIGVTEFVLQAAACETLRRRLWPCQGSWLK